jgi:hypothetical protein
VDYIHTGKDDVRRNAQQLLQCPGQLSQTGLDTHTEQIVTTTHRCCCSQQLEFELGYRLQLLRIPDCQCLQRERRRDGEGGQALRKQGAGGAD